MMCRFIFLLSNKILCDFFQVSVHRQLRQYFINQRNISKPCKSSESGGVFERKPYKKARLAPSAGDDEIAQKRNLELLSSTEESCKGDLSDEEKVYNRRGSVIQGNPWHVFILWKINSCKLITRPGFQRVDSTIHWMNHYPLVLITLIR